MKPGKKENMDIDIRTRTQDCASTIMLCLIFEEDKQVYLDRIFKIDNLNDKEVQMWEKLKDLISVSEAITSYDVCRILDAQIISTNEELEKYFNGNSHSILEEYLDRYETYYKRLKSSDALLDFVYDLRMGKAASTQKILEALEECKQTKSNIEDILPNLEELYKKDFDKTRISTCVDEIDNKNATFRKGTINTVMGYTGCYKTMYSTNVSYQAIKDNLNVCYVSLEISKEDMYYNFLSKHSTDVKFTDKISHSKAKFRILTEDEEKQLFNNILPDFDLNIAKHLIIIDENDFNSNTSVSFDSLFMKVEKSFQEKTGKGIDLIVIDHLNLLKFCESSISNDYAKVNHWMSYFRKSCNNFLNRNKQVCIIIVAQCSRSGYENAKKNDGIYDLTAIAEGNEIERSSENVIALYSDGDLKMDKKIKIQLIKGRNVEAMPFPTLIHVDAEYYSISNVKTNKVNKYDEDDSDFEPLDNDNNKLQNQEITFKSLMDDDTSLKDAFQSIDISPEKREILEKLGVFTYDVSKKKKCA